MTTNGMDKFVRIPRETFIVEATILCCPRGFKEELA